MNTKRVPYSTDENALWTSTRRAYERQVAAVLEEATYSSLFKNQRRPKKNFFAIQLLALAAIFFALVSISIGANRLLRRGEARKNGSSQFLRKLSSIGENPQKRRTVPKKSFLVVAEKRVVLPEIKEKSQVDDGATKINFETPEFPDEVIQVQPPTKLPPLFSLEKFGKPDWKNGKEK